MYILFYIFILINLAVYGCATVEGLLRNRVRLRSSPSGRHATSRRGMTQVIRISDGSIERKCCGGPQCGHEVTDGPRRGHEAHIHVILYINIYTLINE